MYYVVDAAGRVVGVTSYPPDEEDLRGRGERVVHSEANIPPDEAIVAGHPDQPRIARREAMAEPRIQLEVSAEDADGDGVPELVADARSRADIVATVLDAQGQPLQAPVELTFRTTAGSLSRRTVTTEDGRCGGSRARRASSSPCSSSPWAWRPHTRVA